MTVVGDVNRWLDRHVLLPLYSIVYFPEPETQFQADVNKLVKKRFEGKPL